MMTKKVLFLLILIPTILIMTSCNKEKKLSEAERIEQMISEIGEITVFNEETKSKLEDAVSAYNNYVSNSNSKADYIPVNDSKLEELRIAMDAQTIVNYAKSAIDVSIVDIKADLYRPSSFELNLLTIEAYGYIDDENNFSCQYKISIDYSAQTLSGGFSRNTVEFYDGLKFKPHQDSSSSSLVFCEQYNEIATPSDYSDDSTGISSSLAELVLQLHQNKGSLVLSWMRSDINWIE